MSRQSVTIRLTLSVLFLALLTTASPPNNVVFSLHGSSVLRPDRQNDGTLGALAEIATKSVLESWANTSPYYPAAPFEGSTRKGCVVSQVNIVSRDPYLCRTFVNVHSSFKLQRHGARYPTPQLASAITAVLAKLQAVASYNDTKLDFIRNYTYDLGEDDLVRFGAYQ